MPPNPLALLFSTFRSPGFFVSLHLISLFSAWYNSMTANLAWQSAAQTSISLITSALRVQPIQGGLLVPILALMATPSASPTLGTLEVGVILLHALQASTRSRRLQECRARIVWLANTTPTMLRCRTRASLARRKVGQAC